ncbi:Piwi domain-containing protein [Mycena metata]|uniref:Piwi domain-containing protein n=1 Tax=Mycena metata TaxID=1033252 RepID=A0AAD7JXY3_9AGAR|nr:Piwi domain-containing protein [Mycena metata]
MPSQAFTIPFDPDRGPTRLPPKQIRVTLTPVRRVNLSVLRQLGVQGHVEDRNSAINLLNVFIQANPRTQYPSLYGRNTVFASNGEKNKTSIAPLEMWMGIFQSVRPTLRSIVINVDVQTGVVVPEESLPSFCQRYLKVTRLTQLTNHQLQSLRMFLHGVKITVRIHGRPERAVRIKDVVRDVGNREFEKKMPGNQVRTLTVAAHFRELHNIVIVPGSLGVKVGQHELFPVDLCRTVNELYKNKLPGEFTTEVLRSMPNNPERRLQKIERAWKDLEYKNSQFLQGGHIDFTPSPSPMRIVGRLLPSPLIDRSQPEKLKESGIWDVRHGKMLTPADRIDNWIFINCTNTTVVQNFIDELCDVLKARGLALSPPRYHHVDPHAIETKLNTEVRHSRPKLIVALLPDPAPELYVTVKRFGDVEHGIATQCIRWTRKLNNSNNRNQYMNNLILKINTRLGGINFVPQSIAMTELRRVPTMILGGDVSHPAPGSTLPSVAALVSSTDPFACQYVASVNVQASRVEIIQDLEAMVEAAIQRFVDRNGVAPVRCVYFRDGVSEGQFTTVLEEERAAFARALKRFPSYAKRLPSFAFIVCGKKHHIRFFPDPRDADTKGNRNFPAGFIGDRDIGHPMYNDFYLQSQKGLQGTSRPCHYTVLANGTNWTMDMIQQITFSLCHCYSRATKSVKIPAPVYYADLVCARAKFHYDGHVDFEDDISLSSDDPNYATKQYEYYREHFDQVHANFHNSAFSMYFV